LRLGALRSGNRNYHLHDGVTSHKSSILNNNDNNNNKKKNINNNDNNIATGNVKSRPTLVLTSLH
jgi:hypothetical protein